MQNLSIKMIRENLFDIPQQEMPHGYTMRLFKPGDEVTWVNINDEADIYNDINIERFEKEFGYDIDAMSSRCYFLRNEEGEDIGTATAWYNNNYHGAEFGRLHWVAILSEYQGKGLAKPMLSVVLNRLAELHDRAYLTTSTARPIALKIYMDLGFVPDIETEEDTTRWRSVNEYLDHPTLRDETLWHRW